MPSPGSSSVRGFLRDKELLSKSQWQELSRTSPPLDDAALLSDLVRRGWLTSFQAERIGEGNGHELLLGPYRLVEPIGAGGMGQVFKAHHVQMDRVVALKIIPKECLANATAVSRFYREVRAVAKLSHPNVVTAHDAGQHGDTHYLAMEFVEGIDLARLVRQSGPLPITQACAFIRQAALGLQHANELGLVHRDIKPGNIMVGRGAGAAAPVAKVLDFGLARFDDQNAQTRLTKLGNVIGTVDYISPEQLGDARHVDTRADIFSLGCSLYYLLTGRAPFTGATPMDRMMARCVQDAPSVRAARPEVPEALAAIIGKMLARDPAKRYQTPGEVAAALERFASADTTISAAPARQMAQPTVSNASVGSAVSTKALPPQVVGKPGQRNTEVAVSSGFDTLSNGPGIIATSRQKSGRTRPRTQPKRRLIIAGGITVALLIVGIGLWAGGLFGRGGRTAKRPDADSPATGPKKDQETTGRKPSKGKSPELKEQPTIKVARAPRKPLRIAVTRTYEDLIKDFKGKSVEKWDDMPKLLDSLGAGYKYTVIPIEALFDGAKLAEYDVLFFTCGQGATETQVTDNLHDFVSNGGALYASDWRYDAVKLAFPRYRIEGLEGEGRAQKGLPAAVLDADLRAWVGPIIPLDFNLSKWKTAAFGSDRLKPEEKDKVKVLLEGKYTRLKGGPATAPFVVRFQVGKGVVIFTSFHNEKQNTAEEQELLRYLVFSAVTARIEAKVAQLMQEAGFSPRKLNLRSASAGKTWGSLSYHKNEPGQLRFVLGFENPDARLRLTVVAPDGKKFEHSGTATITMDFNSPVPGRWEYTATPEAVPFSNFPFTLTVGETAKP